MEMLRKIISIYLTLVLTSLIPLRAQTTVFSSGSGLEVEVLVINECNSAQNGSVQFSVTSSVENEEATLITFYNSDFSEVINGVTLPYDTPVVLEGSETPGLKADTYNFVINSANSGGISNSFPLFDVTDPSVTVNIPPTDLINNDPTCQVLDAQINITLDGGSETPAVGGFLNWTILVDDIESTTGDTQSSTTIDFANELSQSALPGGTYQIDITDQFSACQMVSQDFVVTDPKPELQNVTTASPLIICSEDDVVLDLGDSEIGVTYEVVVNGMSSGVTTEGTGEAVSLMLESGMALEGDILAVKASFGLCSKMMNGTVTLEFADLEPYTITTPVILPTCEIENVTLDLDGSDEGITYEVLVNGMPGTITAVGTGNPISIEIPTGSYTDSDVITIAATNLTYGCTTLMTGEVKIDFIGPDIQNIVSANDLSLCKNEDAVIFLNDSEPGVNYEILVNDMASGAITTGTGSGITITLESGNFQEEDILIVKASFGLCSEIMKGTVIVDFIDPVVQDLNTTNPPDICSSDNPILQLEGSEVGTSYVVLINDMASGFTADGTGNALDIEVIPEDLENGDKLSVMADNQGCTSQMNGSIVVNCVPPVVSSIMTDTHDGPFRVFPNPTRGSITLDHGSKHFRSQFQVISMSGKVVQAGVINNQAIISIDIIGPRGTYILKIIDAKGESTLRRIVKF